MRISKFFYTLMILSKTLTAYDPESQFLELNSNELQSSLSNIGAEPSTIVGRCVNVISGDFVDHEIDLTIPAPDTFRIERSYNSSSIDGGILSKSWQCNHQGALRLKSHETNHHKSIKAAVKLPFGERLLLEGKEKRHINLFTMKATKEFYAKGVTNISSGSISGQNNIKNLRLELENIDRNLADLIQGSGERYRFRRLRKSNLFEILYRRKPTGHQYHFLYTADDFLKRIEQHNIYNECVGHVDIYKNLINPELKRDTWVTFMAPDGRRVDYLTRCFDTIEKYNIIKEVRRSDGPTISYDIEEADYHKNENRTIGYYARILRKNLPNNRFLSIDYYRLKSNYVNGTSVYLKTANNRKLNRVKTIHAPSGSDASPILNYSFIYHVNSEPTQNKTTKVINGLGNKVLYTINPQNRLAQVLKYRADKSPYTVEDLFWGRPDSSHAHNLKGRSFGYAGSAEKIYARHYTYDGNENMLSETLYGNISGRNSAPLLLDENGKPIKNGVEQNMRVFGYDNDPFHRLKSMKEGDVTIRYEYLGDTSHQISCLYEDSNGIFSRHFYDVDQNGVVICHIRDDGISRDRHCLTGVTERSIDRIFRSHTYPHGLPLEECKYALNLTTGEEELVGKKVQRFDLQGRMVYQEVYGSDSELAFVKEWAYDNWGNLLVEKNGLGNTIVRSYDGNGNCIREEGPMHDSYKTFTYDFMDRLIETNEHHSDGVIISHKYQYDIMGNKTASIDGFGNRTAYEYDAFGRCIKTITTGTPTPEGVITPAVEYHSYDPLGNCTEEIDPMGHSTKTTYTILGKPTRIEYPDGSMEWFYYDLQGHLIEAKTKTGAITLYSRDSQGRAIKTDIYNADGTLFSSTEAGYNSFHLLWEKDPEGAITSYTYDYAGRLTNIENKEAITSYEYDPLSRINKTIVSNPEGTEGSITLVTYDVEGKVLEERVEDLSATSYLLKRNEYDPLGRKTLLQVGDSISLFSFDSHQNVTLSIDPEGNRTTNFNDYRFFNSFGQYVLKTSMTDPRGTKTVTEYNVQGKPYRIQIFNTVGEMLKEEYHYYDPCGQKEAVKIISTGYQGRSAEMQYRFTFDSMKRAVEHIQAYGTKDEKRTKTLYDRFGFKAAIIKPDGVEIRLNHDDLGRLIEKMSTDGTVHEQYLYDNKNNPIQVKNLVTNSSSLRTFDIQGRTTSETLQNGLTVKSTYAYDGALATYTLPDESSVTYSYSAGLLKRAERYKSSGSFYYAHTITSYDNQGRITEEELMNFSGTALRTYTLNGNLKSYISKEFSETDTTYDSMNNLISRSLKDGMGIFSEQFTFDSLGQLQSESGAFTRTYQHDGLHNRISKDNHSYEINSLNQILSDGQSSYQYDLNGNLTGTDDYTITYDALDRLIRVENKKEWVEYEYDELNRCIQRRDQAGCLRFFFISQAEVGACNESGKVIQFQMAGPGRDSAPFEALAVEINGIAYHPSYDQSGHLRCLTSGIVNIENYRYSAFGEMEIYDLFGQKSSTSVIENPWGFAGKRVDPLTGWIQFGRRFYSPMIGRFITQDPAGSLISPNLYAYLLNSPLTHYDTYGLFEFASLSRYGTELTSIAFDITRNIVQAPLYIANNLRLVSGAVLEKLSYQLMPISYIKDIPQAAGHFIQNLNLDGYVPSYKMPSSQWIRIDGSINPDRLHISGNGILNSLAEAFEFGQMTSDAYGGVAVDHFYGASHGLVRDLGECITQLMGVRTHQVKVFENGLKERIDKLGPKGIATVDMHSRGAITLSRVLPNIENDKVNKLWIATYGGAQIIESESTIFSYNYIKTHDFIPCIGDPFSYFGAIFKKNTHVEFVKSSNMGFEHGIENYKSQLEINANNFKQNHGI